MLRVAYGATSLSDIQKKMSPAASAESLFSSVKDKFLGRSPYLRPSRVNGMLNIIHIRICKSRQLLALRRAWFPFSKHGQGDAPWHGWPCCNCNCIFFLKLGSTILVSRTRAAVDNQANKQDGTHTVTFSGDWGNTASGVELATNVYTNIIILTFSKRCQQSLRSFFFRSFI